MPGKPFLIWISGVLKTLIGLASAFPPLIMKCTVKCKVAVPIRKRSLHIESPFPPSLGAPSLGHREEWTLVSGKQQVLFMLCTLGRASPKSGRDLGLGDNKGGRAGQVGAPDLSCARRPGGAAWRKMQARW